MMKDVSGMTISYCVQWSGESRGPVTPLDERDAEKRGEAGEPFGVVVGDVAKPAAFIEVNWGLGTVLVWFFDERRLRYLKYEFKRVGAGKLFMSAVNLWEYPPGEAGEFEEPVKAHFVSYRPDGIVRQVERDYGSREDTITDVSDVELDINWEEVPAFGDWASLARLDRGSPA